MIGKYQCPRIFRANNITNRNLPVILRANSKAWMAAAMFTEWLQLINTIMKAGNRHILSFLDNAPSHPNLQLSNVKLEFFPPNLTAAVQPLDVGIIQSVKLLYRKGLMDRHIQSAE